MIAWLWLLFSYIRDVKFHLSARVRELYLIPYTSYRSLDGGNNGLATSAPGRFLPGASQCTQRPPCFPCVCFCSQRIGQDVFDLAFIMDADGVLIELLHHKLALETETPLAW